MLEAALEALVARLTSADGGADLERARRRFEARVGPVGPGHAPDEPLIRAFFDHYLCEHRSADGSRPPARLLAEGLPEPVEREVARACAHAARSLYRVATEAGAADAGVLEDLLGGGRFRVAPQGVAERLRAGDIFDGRLLYVSGEVRIAPGTIFHPRPAHSALEALVRPIDLDSFRDRHDVLDGLLRIRLRLEHFTSIRPRHLYRLDALAEESLESAGWARAEASKRDEIDQ